MRYVYFVILMLFLAALAGFAFMNRQPLSVGFPMVARRIELPAYFVVLAAYVLGMLSGWTVVGFLRSSIRRASAAPPPRQTTAGSSPSPPPSIPPDSTSPQAVPSSSAAAPQDRSKARFETSASTTAPSMKST